jgi:hypothetical protein
MENKDKHLRDAEKFLNKDEVKRNLVRASLYLFSYELLKTAIVDKIKDFHIRGFDENGYIYSDSYDEKVVHRKVNGKQNIFLSSLHWLEENGAITEDDIIEISSIREFRNTVAHQIDRILADSEYDIDDKLERKIFEFIQKIELWWIKEVEIPTNPEFDGKDVKDDEIFSGSAIFYSYIKSISDELLRK